MMEFSPENEIVEGKGPEKKFNKMENPSESEIFPNLQHRGDVPQFRSWLVRKNLGGFWLRSSLATSYPINQQVSQSDRSLVTRSQILTTISKFLHAQTT
jgi:hypothetical protein